VTTPRAVLGLLLALLSSACDEPAPKAPPPAARMTTESVGYYCQMYVREHEGPKAQAHLESRTAPVWFSQVRDLVAFLRRPDEPRDIAAAYVSDMGEAPSWTSPGDDNWIDAKSAVYVIDSRLVGGMGAPETVPFGTRAAAEAFVRERGGRIVPLDGIPDAYVLGTPAAPAHQHGDAS
jgi:copper chaperone NosL